MHPPYGKWAYRPLPTIEEDFETGSAASRKRRPVYKHLCRLGSSLLLLLLFTAFVTALLWSAGYASFLWPTTTHCQKPAQRKEWRSITTTEQNRYIQAVECLAQQASKFFNNTSRYDDFIRVHGLLGHLSHYTAAFLPWHRFFVHIHEQELREYCGFTGAQPYWDWMLDADDLSTAPIWDAEHGFGGNGALSNSESLWGGYCVTSGPFSGIQRPWLVKPVDGANTVVYEPHCISRSFLNHDDSITDLERKRVFKIHHRVNSEYMETVLVQPDFEAFFRAFENGPHNAIPLFIRGEWNTFSSPNDPVFFLHHTQVDRIWWLWQQRNPSRRLWEFSGATENFLSSPESSGATLTDTLPMAGLVPDSTVAQYMDTTLGSLCYKY